MALKLILDSLDGISEDIKKEYTEKDGKFYLDTISVNGLVVENVTALKSALEAERTSVANLKKDLKVFDGIDADKARVAIDKYTEIENWDGNQKVTEQVEAQKRQLVAQHNAEIEKHQAAIKAAESQLETMLITASGQDALSKAGGNPTLMMPHVLAAARMRKTDDGRYIAEVIDPNGNVRVGDSQGNPMTIPQLIAEMKSKDEFAPAFNGTGNSGTEKPNPSNNPTPRNPGTINAGDLAALGGSLEDIASGKVKVSM